MFRRMFKDEDIASLLREAERAFSQQAGQGRGPFGARFVKVDPASMGRMAEELFRAAQAAQQQSQQSAWGRSSSSSGGGGGGGSSSSSSSSSSGSWSGTSSSSRGARVPVSVQTQQQIISFGGRRVVQTTRTTTYSDGTREVEIDPPEEGMRTERVTGRRFAGRAEEADEEPQPRARGRGREQAESDIDKRMREQQEQFEEQMRAQAKSAAKEAGKFVLAAMFAGAVMGLRSFFAGLADRVRHAAARLRNKIF